ncbi:N-acetylmuramoyl-L-alanine amidase [Streptomyces sulphureus]|uniref:N-acetylmuramoyl-L-alanine amidase n=1 Tax=Streptomyces sulphureus TaxID=47758 RepID=UPI00037107DF|nr:N-acetylmuramoyl-L-alanine amidase [Streptomyces sulphureus]
MSNTLPPPLPDRPPGRRGPRGAVLLALCALVPLVLFGWLGWRVWGGDDGPGTAQRDPDARPSGSPSAQEKELDGRTVVLDPGHHPGNRDHAREINRQVDMGEGKKECDTTGTETEDGYAEAEFTLALAQRVERLLVSKGAEVVLVHSGGEKRGDVEWGPCVDERARIGNEARADAAVSLHADGAPADARGFHVILPGKVRTRGADTRAIVAPSARLGRELASGFRAATGARPAEYIGDGSGLDTRKDLGGLNLSRVPKVFLECGNMRNARDAAQLSSPAWQKRAAAGVADGLTAYLTHGNAAGDRR